MQPGPSKRKQQLCILIADASAGGTRPLDALCEERGHEVHIVRHADAALAAARRLWPDVIFIDTALPPAGGFELVRQLRKDGAFGAVLMAALGAGASQRGEAIEAGFDDELMKPVSAPALDALLRMAR